MPASSWRKPFAASARRARSSGVYVVNRSSYSCRPTEVAKFGSSFNRNSHSRSNRPWSWAASSACVGIGTSRAASKVRAKQGRIVIVRTSLLLDDLDVVDSGLDEARCRGVGGQDANANGLAREGGDVGRAGSPDR